MKELLKNGCKKGFKELVDALGYFVRLYFVYLSLAILIPALYYAASDQLYDSRAKLIIANAVVITITYAVTYVVTFTVIGIVKAIQELNREKARPTHHNEHAVDSVLIMGFFILALAAIASGDKERIELEDTGVEAVSEHDNDYDECGYEGDSDFVEIAPEYHYERPDLTKDRATKEDKTPPKSSSTEKKK